MNQLIWMPNSNTIKNYLIQTHQLFGDSLILSDIKYDFFVSEEGNINSKILFIKEPLQDDYLNEKEKILFANILKALGLVYEDIFLMTLSKKRENVKFSSSFNKLKPLIIIVFGSISDYFLNNKYKGVNIIYTYSLLDMIKDKSIKKDVWKDLKPILNILN